MEPTNLAKKCYYFLLNASGVATPRRPRKHLMRGGFCAKLGKNGCVCWGNLGVVVQKTTFPSSEAHLRFGNRVKEKLGLEAPNHLSRDRHELENNESGWFVIES